MENKKGTIVISGGSRGLGFEIASQFLQQGYTVATFSRGSTEHVTALADDPRFFWKSVDGSDYQALTEFLKEAQQRLGNIVGLVNNAAIGADGVLSTMRTSDIDRALDVNLKAQIYLSKLVSKKLLQNRDGFIINISSIMGVRGLPGVSIYSATKAAMDGMTRSLAKELGRKGIRVNSVSPGYFASDMVKDLSDDILGKIERRTPLGRLGTQSEIAKLVLFLATEGQFITGQNIVIDGGFTC
ncbi:SDR family NAD(P)-dependent oxidoreductase [Pseudoalteromonas obscura]|uniref:SDR family oxidoreductase n=1 Tax=Pseudoalteromonas obscura TaxID=3048491 RepID=A0ABT7ETK6_9GAMM|nr:SDR family oxidoreductase [Pseudoalteromonas sp. P94(2023)]MDK2598363.1 SDR family oxidoreductase [Pseudoalteromonas sp. P94(2023)]